MANGPYALMFSTVSGALKIHAETCPNATKRSGFSRVQLKARTLREATAEVERDADAKARGLQISVCRCALTLKKEVPK